MNYRECYEEGRRLLALAQIEESALDARLLLEHVCGTNRNDLLVRGDREVEARQQEQYLELIDRRKNRIPLQHLTGKQEFMGLEFQVSDKVLIPRQDTEILVEEVMKELHDGMRILDMCTGSGCILISLLHYSNHCQGVGVDVSEDALAVARKNVERILGNLSCEDKNPAMEDGLEMSQISFVHSNLFDKVNGKFDIIVSNPPYIRSEVIDTLMPEVKSYEPRLALDGMEDGLFFYEKIIEESREYLAHGGRLYFEIGYDQAEDVSQLMEKSGFAEIQVVQDYAGLDRVVHGVWI